MNFTFSEMRKPFERCIKEYDTTFEHDYMHNMLMQMYDEVKDDYTGWKISGGESTIYDALINKDEEGFYDEIQTIRDNLTGNENGSYWFNRYEAEAWVVDNWWLLIEAMEEFFSDLTVKEAFRGVLDSFEQMDVTIREYLFDDVARNFYTTWQAFIQPMIDKEG